MILRKSIFLFILLAVGIAPASQTTNAQSTWVWPLDGSIMALNNALHRTSVENTHYGVRNLDLLHPAEDHMTCFGVGWHRLYHAGVDLYRQDGNTANAEVRAIAAGQVVYVGGFYPGTAVIIHHPLENVYSVYMHLQEDDVLVGEGAEVVAGQALGYVRPAEYHGRFPDVHPFGEDDAHLHFEIRHVEDGSYLFPDYPQCDLRNTVLGDLKAGLGYTYPNLPDEMGYLDPMQFLAERIPQPEPPHRLFLPAIYNGDGCIEGQELVRYNGGFEFSRFDPIPWLEVTTYFEPPDMRYYYFVQHDPSAAYAGYQSALLGDAVFAANPIDEELLQSVAIPGGVTWLEWRQRVRLAQTFPLPDDIGTAEGDVHLLTLKDAETGQSVIPDIRIDHTSSDYPNDVWLDLTIVITGVEALKNRPISLSYSSLANGDAVRSTMRLDEVQLIAHCAAVPAGAALQIGVAE